MGDLVDAIRARLALASGTSPPDVILIERHYIVALLQLLAHVDCVERRGALDLDPVSYIARYAGKDLGLTKDMFLTLYTIVSKPDGATYREIYDLCKGRGFIAGTEGRFEMNVRTMIKRLRSRLREAGLSADMIESRPRIGYCWHDPATATIVATVGVGGAPAPYPRTASNDASADASSAILATPLMEHPG